ncbi:hypothetical protein GG344DRAFT_71161, partial [Lentinula edodes]
MSLPSSSAVTGAPNPVLPPVSSPSHPNSTEMTVDAAMDELANTLEEPPLGQLALFRSVFSVGVLLARYIVDDPLWPLLAAAGLPCSFCIRGKKEANCSVVPHLARCSNCDDKKRCVLGQLARFRYFSRFWRCMGTQWRDIAAKIEASTNSTVALIELNSLDEQDQQELDRLELGEFLRKQPQLPRPSTTNSLPSPIPSVVATPRALAKKRKRSIWQEEGGSSSLRKRPIKEVSEPEVAPEVHNCKRKHPVGESRDAEVPDYRRVVLVLHPPLVDPSGSVPLSGDRVDEVVHPPPPSEESGSARVPLPPSQAHSSVLLGRKWSNSPGLSSRFIPPVVSERRSAVTISTPPPSQAENDALRAEVADLRKLLEASWTETLTLTSLLRETTTSLDNCNKDLEASRRALQDVAADHLEYGRVLAQFRAIEAELPQAPLEDALTRFHLAVAEEQKRSYEAHKELDTANARAICLRDRLEDLEETVHRYRMRAHVAEELIRKYPEDEGLYEVDLPLLSSLQDKLTASECKTWVKMGLRVGF